MTIDVRPQPSTPSSPGALLEPDTTHEHVVIRQDHASGMRLIIAVHSTVLGPALGGLRLRPYSGGLPDALGDVLALARTMTLKASAAGLDLGGGKAVMIDDGDVSFRRARFEAAAEAIDALGGAYITAEDIGTSPRDMDVIAERTAFVVGTSRDRGGAGDPSPSTAATVHRALLRALEAAYGSSELEGRRIGIVGLGKVGGALAARLAAGGASVAGADLNPAHVERLADEHGILPVPSAEALFGAKLDVLAPCATGGLIDEAIAGALDCRIVCGAANNPLTGRAVARRLAEREILYVPDFLANCGGLIHVDTERFGFDGDLVEARIERAMARLDRALAATDVTPVEAAERDALARVAAAQAEAAAHR